MLKRRTTTDAQSRNGCVATSEATVQSDDRTPNESSVTEAAAPVVAADAPSSIAALTVTVREPRRRQRGAGGPPSPVDPLDASLAFPRRKGAIQPPPFNLLPILQTYSENEQGSVAVAHALCRVSVGASYVTVFGTLWRLMRADDDDHLSEWRDKLLRHIHANPYAYQNAVERGCRITNNATERWWYAADLAPEPGVAKVVLRSGEVMDLWRWPATSASQQRSYALLRCVLRLGPI
jgi:hypothetical protein